MLKKTTIQAALFLIVLIMNLDGISGFQPTESHFILLAILLTLFMLKAWKLLHGALLAMLLHVIPYISTWLRIDFSALLLLILVALSTACIVPFSVTRDSLGWVKKGHIDRITTLLLVATGIGSTIALLLWASMTDSLGYGLKIAQSFSHYPVVLVLSIGVPLFALLNALAEEIVYRGVFQAMLNNVFSFPVTAVLQATAFAAIHYAAGFPNGVTGYGMVFVYGVMLGYLRKKSGGMLAPYLAHVLADLVIGYYLCVQVYVIA